MKKAPIKHVPPPVEISSILAAEWDIAAMQAYLAKRNLPAQEAEFTFDSLRGFFGDDEPPAGAGTFRIGMFGVDRERAMTDEIDPSIPIIIADVTGNDGQVCGRVPIDGRHRMYKAWKTASSDPITLPFHFISGPEELQFRTARSTKPTNPTKPKKARRQ